MRKGEEKKEETPAVESGVKATKRKAVIHFEEGKAPRMVDPTEIASGQLMQFCTTDGLPVQGGGTRDPEYCYSAIPVDVSPASKLRQAAEFTIRGYAPVKEGVIVKGLAGAQVWATTRENKENLDRAELEAKAQAEAASLARMKENATKAAEGAGARIWQTAGEAEPQVFK
jgi:hypothetical protein